MGQLAVQNFQGWFKNEAMVEDTTNIEVGREINKNLLNN